MPEVSGYRRCGAFLDGDQCDACRIADRYPDLRGPDTWWLTDRAVWGYRTAFLFMLSIAAGLIAAGWYRTGAGAGIAGCGLLGLFAIGVGARLGIAEAAEQSVKDGRDRQRSATARREHRDRLLRGIIGGLAGLPSLPGCGYLYIIEFSTGGVKVGKTQRPLARFREHERDAAPYGVVITRCWWSDPDPAYERNETVLIERCKRLSPVVRKEYFPRLSFSRAAAVATEIRLPGHENLDADMMRLAA